MLQLSGENAIIHFTTVVCRYGSSRTIVVHFVSRSGSSSELESSVHAYTENTDFILQYCVYVQTLYILLLISIQFLLIVAWKFNLTWLFFFLAEVFSFDNGTHILWQDVENSNYWNEQFQIAQFLKLIVKANINIKYKCCLHIEPFIAKI